MLSRTQHLDRQVFTPKLGQNVFVNALNGFIQHMLFPHGTMQSVQGFKEVFRSLFNFPDTV